MADRRSLARGWDSKKNPPGLDTACSVVLSVSPNHEDIVSLDDILKSAVATATIASPLSVLQEVPIPIVICDLGAWDMLAKPLDDGYAGVPTAVMEKAAETLANPNLGSVRSRESLAPTGSTCRLIHQHR